MTPSPAGVQEQRLRALLKELHVMVWGECPSLFNEDSGGDAELDMRIRAALQAPQPAQEPVTPDQALQHLVDEAQELGIYTSNEPVQEPSPALPASEPEHVCGLAGYNGMIDPPCPGCERKSAQWDDVIEIDEHGRVTKATPEQRSHLARLTDKVPALPVEPEARDGYESLRRLEPGWDYSSGAVPIDARAIAAAKDFEARVVRVPLSDGGVQLEWNHPEIGLEVEFSADGHVNGVLVADETQDGHMVELHPGEPPEPEARLDEMARELWDLAGEQRPANEGLRWQAFEAGLERLVALARVQPSEVHDLDMQNHGSDVTVHQLVRAFDEVDRGERRGRFGSVGMNDLVDRYSARVQPTRNDREREGLT